MLSEVFSFYCLKFWPLHIIIKAFTMDTSGIHISKCKEHFYSLYRSFHQGKTIKFHIASHITYQFPLKIICFIITESWVFSKCSVLSGGPILLPLLCRCLENPIPAFSVFLSYNSSIKIILESCLLWEA